ncbi:hypothetical protein BJ138DRAFT_1111569 [Hygrophoropsis aurantiaca]|uniref:Uncharacterized protein n=1 Tax=Hygrophoropsis aurantiaca TaxID=72124 RepID=A0ACB8AL71_9AGAM|nr:hypothetical protein BJ138DRAFT_1111569 [Hygrophoropsis aurantiaca]
MSNIPPHSFAGYQYPQISPHSSHAAEPVSVNERQSRPSSSHSSSHSNGVPLAAQNQAKTSGIPSIAIKNGADSLLALIDNETTKATQELRQQLAELLARYEQLRIASAAAWKDSTRQRQEADTKIWKLQSEAAQGKENAFVVQDNALQTGSHTTNTSKDVSQATGAHPANLTSALNSIGIIVGVHSYNDGSCVPKIILDKEFAKYLVSKIAGDQGLIEVSSSSNKDNQDLSSPKPNAELEGSFVNQFRAVIQKYELVKETLQKETAEFKVKVETLEKEVKTLQALRQSDAKERDGFMTTIQTLAVGNLENQKKAKDTSTLLESSQTQVEEIRKERNALAMEKQELYDQLVSLRATTLESQKLKQAQETVESQFATILELQSQISLLKSQAGSSKATELKANVQDPYKYDTIPGKSQKSPTSMIDESSKSPSTTTTNLESVSKLCKAKLPVIKSSQGPPAVAKRNTITDRSTKPLLLAQSKTPASMAPALASLKRRADDQENKQSKRQKADVLEAPSSNDDSRSERPPSRTNISTSQSGLKSKPNASSVAYVSKSQPSSSRPLPNRPGASTDEDVVTSKLINRATGRSPSTLKAHHNFVVSAGQKTSRDKQQRSEVRHASGSSTMSPSHSKSLLKPTSPSHSASLSDSSDEEPLSHSVSKGLDPKAAATATKQRHSLPITKGSGEGLASERSATTPASSSSKNKLTKGT